MNQPSSQALRISRAIREQVRQLDAVGAAFLAVWLVIVVVAALVVLVYVAAS